MQPDQSGHLDVAAAHPVRPQPPQQPVEPVQRKHPRAGPQQGFPAGSQQRGEAEQQGPDEVAGQHDHVRQPPGVEVDQGQHHAAGGEAPERGPHQPAGTGGQRPGPGHDQRHEREQHPGGRLDDRVADGDRRGARGAAAAQHDPAEHGHVVPGPDRGVAVRAAALPQQRDSRGHAVGDDVEERADHEPEGPGEQCDHPGGRGEAGHHGLSRWATRPVMVSVPPAPPPPELPPLAWPGKPTFWP